MSLFSRILNALRGDRLNRELDEEFEAHIAEAIARGRDPGEARRAFGSVLRQREASRDARLSIWLDSLRADIVFGWRQLRRHKIASGAAILSLALAIGACTSAFRLIDALLLRPLPVTDPDRLHVVLFAGTAITGYPMVSDSSSYPMFERMRDSLSSQADVVAVSYMDRPDVSFGAPQDIERVYLQYVSGRMFPLFGLRPAAGSLLTGEDDLTPGAHPYAVLSYDFWKRRFGRDPAIVGRTFRRGDTLFQIIGVAPEGFTGTETGSMTEVFVPMMMKTSSTLGSPNNFWLRTFVKLKPGVNREPVYQRLRALFHDIQVERAKTSPNPSQRQLDTYFSQKLLLEPAAGGRSNLQRDLRQPLGILAVLVALVLLIASANVANLMTARAAARNREMALRVSIGAGRRRLLQLLMVESAWIALLASVAGALFAWWAAPFVVGLINPPNDPARLELSADWRVLAFGVALTLTVTLLFGLTPALRASAIKPAAALKGGDDPHSRHRLMHGLILAQVAFCFLVLFVAGLFIGTFNRLGNQPTGFSADRILNLETVTRNPQPAAYWDEVASRLRAVPGVERVATTTWPMMIGESGIGAVALPGAVPPIPFVDFISVSPGWVETMKIALLDGREFRDGDLNPGVALVNQAFVKQYFENGSPVGKWVERIDSKQQRVRLQVVGLIADARSRDNRRVPIRPTVYVPLRSADAQGLPQPRARGTFVVRTAAADSLSLASALRDVVTRTRPEFHVDSVRTQQEIGLAPMLRERLLAMLAAFFAVVALALAGVGLFGVLDYSVAQRTREIGIRMAIGARAGDIARNVTATLLMTVSAGAVLGVLLGTASARYVKSLLFGVQIVDPRSFAIPAISLLVITLVAAIRPVSRAVRTDPANVLRAD